MTVLPQLTHVTMRSAKDLLARLRPGRGRLVFTHEAVQHARAAAQHPLGRVLAGQVHASAAELLAQPVLSEGGHGAARQALDRFYTLLMAFHLTGEARYNVRAVAEIEAVSQWPTLGHGDFLGTAETMHALAVGLDGVSVDAATHGRWVEQLVHRQLEPALAALACLPWWHRDTCNWNTVCNGGIILGALAAADRAPALAARLIVTALAGMPNALATFAPDGGWPEGPGYAMFAMRYLLPAAGALGHALHDEMRLLDYPGVREAGLFRVHTEGPTGLLFNYADCYEAAPPEPCLFGLARRFDMPAVAAFARASFGRGGPYVYFGSAARALLWFDERGGDGDLKALPRDAQFVAAAVATFRSDWLDKAATYVAIKGGEIQAPHGHADLGTFVLDAHGQRFVTDLGPDHYDLPGFWHGRPNTDLKRWSLYRTGTMGHNTLLVGGAGQHHLATADLAGFQSDAQRGSVMVDLSAAYAHAGLTRALRQLVFDRATGTVTIVDALTPARPVDVQWQIHTTAAVSVDGPRATLTLGGKSIGLVCETPGATLAVEEVQLPPESKPLLNTRRLMVKLRVEQGTELRVVFRT